MKNEKLKVELTPELVKTTYDEISDALSYLDLKKQNNDFFYKYVCACVRMKIEEENEEMVSGTEQQEQPMTAVKENLTTIDIVKRTASCLWITVICVMGGLCLCANYGILTVFFILMSVMVALIGAVLGPKWLRNEWTKVFEVEA